MDKNKAISGYEKIFDDGYKAGRASVVLPHPCDGELYKDWLLIEYIAKVLEEAKEVVDAYIDLIKDPKNPERIKHLAGECTDVQVAATGVMHKLGYGEEERQRVMKEINESNAKRDGGKRFKKHPFDELQERICREKTFSASGTEEKEDGKQIKLAKNNLLLPLEIGAKLMVVKPDDYKNALPGENIYRRMNQFKIGDRVIIFVPKEYIINMRGNDMMSAIRNNGKIGEILQDMNNDTYIVKVGNDHCCIAFNFLKKVKKNG